MKNTYETNVIATFDGKDQEFHDLNIPQKTMKTEKGMRDYLKNYFCGEGLRKISLCINTTKNRVPAWIIDCNGKLFFD